MSNDLGCKIDEEFREQLENATFQDPKAVIINIRKTSEVEKLFAELRNYPEGSPEKLQHILVIEEAQKRMMKPICQYLDNLGVSYRSLAPYHMVTSQMAPRQILELLKQPYVENIGTADGEVRSAD